MEQIKLPTGEILYKERLPNGLAVFVLPKPKFLRTYGVLSTNYGSIDSSFEISEGKLLDVPAGIAHFLEHKLFEEEEGNVFERFAGWGAAVNAFTSYTQTSYLFSTTGEWQKALVELLEFVNRPYLTEENVAKEKGIIEQELLMYQDHPDHRLHSTLLENLYQNNPVRLDIGGTVESVHSITVDDLLECYQTFYQPENMALAVVGKGEVQEVLDLVRESYPEWKHKTGPIVRHYPEEPRAVGKDWAEADLNISRPRYLLGFKHDPIWQGEDLLKQQIIMSLGWRLIAARSSRHYLKLYEEGLIDDSFGASFNVSPHFSYSVVGSETADPEALHAQLVKIIKEVQQESCAPTELERLKRQVYGGHIASYDSFEYAANRFISHYFYNTPYHKFLDLVRAVTVQDIQSAFSEHLDWERCSVSILRPVNGQ